MLTGKQVKKLQEQLYVIHDELLTASHKNDQEVWWSTPFYINPDEYEFRESYDLFNGNCGILLFFLELYRYDGKIAHLDIVKKGIFRVLNAEKVQEPDFFALYTGLGGVIYTCLKIYELTNEVFYREKALALTLKHREQLTIGLQKTDILSGYSGNLLLLTLLYHYTKDNEVLNMVSILIDRLVTEARISEQGLKWDYSRSKKAYDSMTGFSHGASGIAWVLMQVGEYFNDDGLIYLAGEALKHEMLYYHQPAKNWLDLRLGPHRLNKPSSHEWKMETFLADMTDVNAWAHGAAGVGLTRQLAFTITGNQEYLMDCENAMERCLSDLYKLDRADFTLVSGYAGMIPFLSNCGKRAEVLSILDNADKLYSRTRSYNTYVSCGIDDYGLLSGKAGLGYIILNVLNEKNMDSILAPKLPKNIEKSVFKYRSGINQVKKFIFSKYYARTLNRLQAVDATIFDAEDINEFKIKLQHEVEKSDYAEIQKQFDLENSLVDSWRQHKGYFSFEQKNKYLLKMADESLSITDLELLEKLFGLSTHVKIHRQDNDNELNVLLLVSEGDDIKEIKVGVFAAMILNIIANKRLKGVELVESLLSVLFKENPTEKALSELKDKVVQQIRLLIKAGFICW